MRAVVTGCAGFIGSHLCETLIDSGWDVTGVDAFTDYYDPSEKEANLASLAAEPNFDLLRLDLATADLDPIFADQPHVFHLAGQPGVRGSFGSGFAQYVRDNIEATQRVFEAALNTGTKRVVYASSSSVYGDATSFPVFEDKTPTQPRSPYGVTKRTCEDLGNVYRNSGLETVGLRYFTVFGPRQRPDMAMRRLCETAFDGPEFVLHGDGLQSRDFTHVSDAVDATIRAATVSTVSPVLNIGGGNVATMLEVIDIISELAGHRLPIVAGPPQRGDVRRTGGDTTRARRQLGWRPQVNLEAGLETLFKWVERRHGGPVERTSRNELDNLIGAAR